MLFRSAPGQNWEAIVREQQCPFLGRRCYKVRKSSAEVSIGSCTVLYGSGPIIICPTRLIERRQIFIDCLHLLTNHEPGNELHIVSEVTVPGGSVDYFLVSARMDVGQRTPGGVATRDPEASHDEASPSESWQKHETLWQPAYRANRRGSRLPIPSEPAPRHRPWITPQGATPAERIQPYHASRCLEHQDKLRRHRPRLAQTHCGRVKQSRLRPIPLAGFEVTT